MSWEYGELRPTNGWDRLTSLGHPCKFQLVSRLGSVTARHLVVGVSHTLRRWAEGVTYIRQGDHHVGHWPTFLVYELTFIAFRVTCRRRKMYIGHARLQCVYVRLCVSVPRRIPTLLHRPGRKVCCALLGGFAIGPRVSLLWQHSRNAKCQRVLVLALCLVNIQLVSLPTTSWFR